MEAQQTYETTRSQATNQDDGAHWYQRRDTRTPVPACRAARPDAGHGGVCPLLRRVGHTRATGVDPADDPAHDATAGLGADRCPGTPGVSPAAPHGDAHRPLWGATRLRPAAVVSRAAHYPPESGPLILGAAARRVPCGPGWYRVCRRCDLHVQVVSTSA